MDLARQGHKKYLGLIVSVLLILSIIIVGFNLGWNKPEYRELTKEELDMLMIQRREAYNFAVTCGNVTNPELTFEQIEWVLIPGNMLDVEAIDGRIRLKGFYNPTDSTIYVPFSERETFWIIAHESMHAIGVSGHPRVPFETCRLLADQN